MKRLNVLVPFVLLAFVPFSVRAEIQGEPKAVAKVETLLESVGGKASWQNRYFYVEETAYLISGAVANLRIWRDLEETTRYIYAESPGRVFREIMEKDHGFSLTNGVRRDYSETEFAIEKAGREQGPYYVYHRLAKGDERLRVQYKEDKNRLDVYDGGRLLCWFLLNGQGRILSWGNIFDGEINQHIYGPLQDFGSVRLPKWGAAINGNWRFEYTLGELSPDARERPPE